MQIFQVLSLAHASSRHQIRRQTPTNSDATNSTLFLYFTAFEGPISHSSQSFSVSPAPSLPISVSIRLFEQLPLHLAIRNWASAGWLEDLLASQGLAHLQEGTEVIFVGILHGIKATANSSLPLARLCLLFLFRTPNWPFCAYVLVCVGHLFPFKWRQRSPIQQIFGRVVPIVFYLFDSLPKPSGASSNSANSYSLMLECGNSAGDDTNLSRAPRPSCSFEAFFYVFRFLFFSPFADPPVILSFFIVPKSFFL